MKQHLVPSIEKRLGGSDALILPFGKKSQSEDIAIPLFDSAALGLQSGSHAAISSALHVGAFRGKEEEVLTLYVDAPHEKRVVLVGIGIIADIHHDTIRASYARAIAKVTQEEGIRSVSIALPDSSETQEPSVQEALADIDRAMVARAVIEGVGFGLYRFTRYMTSPRGSSPQEICYISSHPTIFMEQEKIASAVMRAVHMARDMVNMNACEMTPKGIAQEAQSLQSIPGMSVVCHGKEWIQDQKMGLLLAVSQGSSIEPQFVIIDWKGKESTVDRTVFVGKGVTYDTGGLNIKPTGSMETMRADMAGAASVIALMKAIGELQLPIWATALVPLTDNAVDSLSYRPGDVFISRKGTSVEIVSTDAEGRLILADALDYARTDLKPSRIIDVATLTGSSEIALGSDISALFANSDALAFDLEKASKRASEPLWRMPLYGKYAPLIRSDYADLKNAAGRAGGAINAALFLEHFVGDIPWAHFDIAGPAYVKEGRRYFGKGATGIPVRTLIELCLAISQ